MMDALKAFGYMVCATAVALGFWGLFTLLSMISPIVAWSAAFGLLFGIFYRIVTLGN